MDILKFTLSGRNAFFKKPDVNARYYFTFGNIHKVALMGMLGAICGYSGYTKQKEDNNQFPEFYEKLRNIKIAIVPNAANGKFSRKIQGFNNSVGYACQESGGNLMIMEQWLDNPSWEIYVQIDEVSRKIAERIMNKECDYIPYLGKNDHPADIADCYVYKEIPQTKKYTNIDSLFPENDLELDMDYDDDDFLPFKYSEYLPCALNSFTNMYEYRKMVFTNIPVTDNNALVYQVNGKHIVFF